MAYKCVHCSQIYSDGAKEILEGCSSCGSKFFFYLSKKQMEKLEQAKEEISFDEGEIDRIEKDVREIVGIEDDEEPVYLDFESVKMMKQGKYLIDIGKLFDKEKPRIYKLEDGKYIIDIAIKK